MRKLELRGDDWNDLVAAIMADPDARTAYLENNIRNQFGKRLSHETVKVGVPFLDSLLTGGTRKDVLRLLNEVKGGDVLLRDMVRAADAVGYNLRITWEKQDEKTLRAKNDCGDETCESCLNNHYGCPGRNEKDDCPDTDEEDDS